MNVFFLIDADNLSLAAWIEETCRSLESTLGSLAARRGLWQCGESQGLCNRPF
jgi:hypothetical protein